MKTKISQFIRPGIYFNLGYNNSEIDKLFTQVKSASTADEQVKLYRNIDEILCRDVPELWIYDSPYASPRRNTFQGYTQYDVIPESGPTEVVWWTQGTPMVTATATTATTQTMAPTISSEWVVVAVIAVIVLAGAYIAYTRRKKKTT
jgi:ABC-type transport system substrate-binding protein